MASKLHQLRDELEGEHVRDTETNEAIIDEFQRSEDGETVLVYVRGDVEDKSPPMNLNRMMFERGYSYIDWTVNGILGDNRSVFRYKHETKRDDFSY